MTMKLKFLSDDFHFAIANVAVRSSQMEHHIEQTLDVALNEHRNTAEFLLKNMGQDRIVKGMGAAMIDAYPDEAAIVGALVAEIGRVRTERNEILHFVWGKAEKAEEAVQASFRPFRPMQVKNKTVNDVTKVARDMMLVTRTLIDWQDAVFQKRRSALLDKLVPPIHPNNLGGLLAGGPLESGEFPAPPEDSSQK